MSGSILNTTPSMGKSLINGRLFAAVKKWQLHDNNWGHKRRTSLQQLQVLPGGELTTKMICISNLAADNLFYKSLHWLFHNT